MRFCAQVALCGEDHHCPHPLLPAVTFCGLPSSTLALILSQPLPHPIPPSALTLSLPLFFKSLLFSGCFLWTQTPAQIDLPPQGVQWTAEGPLGDLTTALGFEWAHTDPWVAPSFPAILDSITCLASQGLTSCHQRGIPLWLFLPSGRSSVKMQVIPGRRSPVSRFLSWVTASKVLTYQWSTNSWTVTVPSGILYLKMISTLWREIYKQRITFNVKKG